RQPASGASELSLAVRRSGVVLRTPRNDGGAIARLFLQMLFEKRQAARPGDVGAGLVVAGALVAVKAMLRAGIDVDFDIRPLGLDGFDIGQRNARILFAEMQLRRHSRLVVGETNDGATIIADGGRQAGQL